MYEGDVTRSKYLLLVELSVGGTYRAHKSRQGGSGLLFSRLAQHFAVVPPLPGSCEAYSTALKTTAECCVGGKSTAVV